MNILRELNLDKSKGHPFQVVANVGPLIVLPPAMMEEVRNDERITFKAWLRAVGSPFVFGSELTGSGIAFLHRHAWIRRFCPACRKRCVRAIDQDGSYTEPG